MARKSNVDWLAVFEAWEQSGKSKKTFCEEQGISLWAFRNWRKQQVTPKTTTNAVERAGSFVNVTSAQNRDIRQAASGICRIMRNGYCIEVSDGVTRETIVTALQALETVCGPTSAR